MIKMVIFPVQLYRFKLKKKNSLSRIIVKFTLIYVYCFFFCLNAIYFKYKKLHIDMKKSQIL